MRSNELIKVCPQCGSIHIYWIAGGALGAVYKCDDCNYIGSFVLEIEATKLVEFQRELRKEEG